MNIKNWYKGKNEGYVKVPYFGRSYSFRRKYHWTALIARKIVFFYFENWKWVWGVIITVVIAFIKLG